jgi:hypothetical protein
MRKPQPLTYEYGLGDLRLRMSGVDDVGRSFHIVLVGEDSWRRLIKLADGLKECLEENQKERS